MCMVLFSCLHFYMQRKILDLVSKVKAQRNKKWAESYNSEYLIKISASYHFEKRQSVSLLFYLATSTAVGENPFPFHPEGILTYFHLLIICACFNICAHSAASDSFMWLIQYKTQRTHIPRPTVSLVMFRGAEVILYRIMAHPHGQTCNVSRIKPSIPLASGLSAQQGSAQLTRLFLVSLITSTSEYTYVYLCSLVIIWLCKSERSS